MDDVGPLNAGTTEAARLSRRSMLKGALAAQAAVWAAPTVMVLRPDPALAGSPPPTTGASLRPDLPERADLPDPPASRGKGLGKGR